VSAPTPPPAWLLPSTPQAPSAPPRRREGRYGTGVLVTAVAISALVAGGLGGTVGGAIGYFTASTASPSAAAPTVTLPAAPGISLPASGSIADIAAAVQPAVVQLQVEGMSPGATGSGSGFVISDDGYIVTNHHVAGVAGKEGTINVVFSDGSTANGTMVGSSPGYDLAVVKVDRADLPTVPLGASKALNVGDLVIALGSPLGLQGTVTSGIVSALDRPVSVGGGDQASFINAIQTDAAINPGNSGGPLVDGNGTVVGVNSAIATTGGFAGNMGSIGLGFAIPIDVAKRIVEEIITTGSSRTPIIGVQLDMTFEGPGGKIAEVNPDGAADQAGIRVGDIITKVDGAPVADGTALIVKIRANAPGDAIALTVVRNGREQQVELVLGETSAF
jgi:putative serine protease PepD